MPRRQPSRLTGSAKPRRGGDHHDLVIEAISCRGGRQHGVETVIESGLQVVVVEALPRSHCSCTQVQGVPP